MKKISVLVLFYVLSVNMYCQICGEVEYTFKTDIAYEYIEKYSMKFNNEMSLCTEIDIKHLDSKRKNIDTDEGRTIALSSERKNLGSKFYYNKGKDFYFKDIFEDENLLVKENAFSWKWNLLNDTKFIGGFKCQKATIRYRGRNYISWFTNEIPVIFGPWKFQGLSGLILEVYDEGKEFHIYSNKIKIENKNCTIKVDESEFKKSLSINEYLKRKEELLNEVFAKMASKMPKGSKVPKWDKDCEDCSKGIEIFDDKN